MVLLKIKLNEPPQDEAFELGYQWANAYEPSSPSRSLIRDMMDTFFLVNVVHNDFKDSDAIFQPFFKVGAAHGLSIEELTNGVHHLSATDAN
jgi:methylenetetrahydrofolate reductase (NADPH)